MKRRTQSYLAGFAVLPAAIALAATPVARAQADAAQALTLQNLERMALERNPAIGQARAAVNAAAGRAKQAGLYPNPIVGAVGEEISAVRLFAAANSASDSSSESSPPESSV